MKEVTVEKVWDSNSQQIVPCDACKGSGVITKEECVSYHNRDYEYVNVICQNCDGDGRLLQTKYTVKIRVNIPDQYAENVDFSKSYFEKLYGRTPLNIYPNIKKT